MIYWAFEANIIISDGETYQTDLEVSLCAILQNANYGRRSVSDMEEVLRGLGYRELGTALQSTYASMPVFVINYTTFCFLSHTFLLDVSES